MHVSQIMSKPVTTVEPDAPIREVARLLLDKGAGSVVVEMDTPLGIVTETDMIRLIADGMESEGLTASEVMSDELVTIDGFATVEEAARTMRENGIRKLPVIYGGALVGMVTTTDISYHFSEIVEGDTMDRDEIVEMLEDEIE